MKRSFFWFIIFFILLTTYQPNFTFFSKFRLNIQDIEIKNVTILKPDDIKKKINFLYNEKLFFLNIKDIKESLKPVSFIESFSIKKIYPNKLRLIIVEKKPIAIIQNKKEKSYISDKGDLIKFENIEIYNDLPTVFGNEIAFYSLYKDLKNIKFSTGNIKSFYFFESGRWDLIMKDNKVIKLPINNYLFSLENFMKTMKNDDFKNYKIFDYRIKDQIILN